ncbi:MAG: TonB-dependent receptor [Flavobacteriaceae bacterium]|nr:TonB-dependent receptor [Flavobacteriaceae bacterium]
MLEKTTKLFSYLLIPLLLISGALHAQDSGKLSLIYILSELETEHDVRFSYVPSELEEIVVQPIPRGSTLDQAIEHLALNSSFNFARIDDRYISVSKKTNSASDLCGKITDQRTGQALEGATITVGDGQFVVLSGSNGNFYIPKEYNLEQLTIQFLGYSEKKIQATQINSECPRIPLTASYSQLEEVLLQQLWVQGIDRNFDGSTTINTTNFGLLPGQIENDVLQMTQVIPGVESVNETISTINIRGGSNDENLILWEGNRMFQTGHFFGLISAFNPHLTKNVSIYKGGTPANYGESVSGVIDMASTNELPARFHGGAGVNLIHANAFLEIPLSNKVGIQLSGRGSNNELFNTPVYNSYAQRIFQDTEITNIMNEEEASMLEANESFRFFDLGAKLLWNPSEKDEVRANVLTIDNELDFTETLLDLAESKTSKLQQRSLVAGISWKHNWSSKFETSSRISGSYYLLDALNTDIFTNQELFQENEVLETGIRLDTRYKIDERFKLITGYHFTEIGIGNTQDVNLPRFRDFTKDVLRSHIVYSMLQYKSPNKKTVISTGVRGNYFTKFDQFRFEPRLHLFTNIGHGFGIELSGEMRSQTATQRIDFESDFLGVEKRRWVLANQQDIPIKKSAQAGLGLTFNKNNWFLNIEGFYKQVEGITSKSQGFQNQFQFVNAIGNYDAKGIEFILNKKFDRFSSWITYGFTHNQYEFDAIIPKEFPNNIDIRHTAKIAGSYQWNQLKLALGFQWRTGKPFTTPREDRPIELIDGELLLQFNDPNQQRLPEYVRLDASVEYFWNLFRGLDAKVNLSMLNLLDRKNTLNIRYTLEEVSGEITVNRIAEQSLGFTPNLSIQILF